MASVGWQGGKCMSWKQAGSLIAHCDKETRKQVNHSNPHIDKSKTDDNLQLYDETTEETMLRLRARVDELLGGRKLRDDQPVLHSLNVPIPPWVKEGEEFKFLLGTIGALNHAIIPPESIIQAYLHKDEVHKYIDPDTLEERESLRHIHVLCVPTVEYQIKKCLTPEEKEIRKRERAEAKARGEKWNAKTMSSVKAKKRRVETPGIGHLSEDGFFCPENLAKANQAMDDFCEREFGRKYTLGKKGRKKSVEQLKRESKQAEVLYNTKKAMEDAKADYENKLLALNQQELTLQSRQQDLDDLEQRLIKQKERQDKVALAQAATERSQTSKQRTLDEQEKQQASRERTITQSQITAQNATRTARNLINTLLASYDKPQLGTHESIDETKLTQMLTDARADEKKKLTEEITNTVHADNKAKEDKINRYITHIANKWDIDRTDPRYATDFAVLDAALKKDQHLRKRLLAGLKVHNEREADLNQKQADAEALADAAATVLDTQDELLDLLQLARADLTIAKNAAYEKELAEFAETAYLELGTMNLTERTNPKLYQLWQTARELAPLEVAARIDGFASFDPLQEKAPAETSYLRQHLNRQRIDADFDGALAALSLNDDTQQSDDEMTM